MSLNSRSKGQRGERELCSLLEEYLGYEAVRNLQQTRSGGDDITWQLEGFSIEVKRREKFNECHKREAWEQTVRQAKALKQIPVLAFRRNHRPWKFLVPLCSSEFEGTMELYVDAFTYFVREQIAQHGEDQLAEWAKRVCEALDDWSPPKVSH